MKSKLFGSSKSKPQADPSSNYQSPLPAHQRAPSPGYPQSAQQSYSASQSQSTLERSPSLRQTSGGQFAPRPPPAEGSLPPEVLEQRLLENRNSVYFNQQQSGSPLVVGAGQPVHEEKKKHGFRDKFGFGHSSKLSHDAGSSGAPSKHSNAGLGRSLSVSKKRESVPPEKYYQQQGPAQGQIDARSPYRRSANSSQNLLDTHTEEDEDAPHNIYPDPRFSQKPPPPPAKEPDYEREHRYSQQPVPPQAYYKDHRSLARVQTDHAAQSGQGGQPDPRSPGTQTFYHDDDGSSNRDSYNPYQPGEDEATPSTPYHTSAEDAARYSSYSQQPPAYSQHGRIPSGPHQQPELHYPQPGPGRASLDKYNRPSSQPQGPPGGSHDQRADAANPLFLQAPPPRGASLEGPPSPLVPAGPPPLGLQKGPQPSPSPQPPSTADSAQSTVDPNMPQSNQSRGNNTIRSVGADKNAAPRESSGTQASPPVPPHKQGVAAFGANMVPAGSQGAPFRGPQAAAAAAAGSQKGRDSPAPEMQMAPAELVDEEAAGYLQLQKEFKELREKYQKVKKYYFEKEAQVHSLQNTLAHQRLAASRTSLDDTEYAARFTRLDGLISQLAFSIRKSWKAIPDFLQRGVNKDAIATGKQEMTAVGRAYMSQWLVSNLFDMYFHPSLELGLSRDLKEVWHNVRKYCPPFQSGEEEEALNAKLVNWRMTTIDGLQERLRAPEASQHYSRLVDMLNEKMVGDMALLLSDPAPPDLAGGVSMIIELAVSVAQHIPLESRDVAIEYFYPGTPIVPDLMKLETGIPQLVAPIVVSEISPSSAGDAAERASLQSTDTRESADPRDSTDGPSGAAAREEKKARGMFGGLMSGSSGGAKVQKPAPTSQAQVVGKPPGASAATAGRETPSKEEKVRLSVGISVQIRGRSVLSKAMVYGMAV